MEFSAACCGSKLFGYICLILYFKNSDKYFKFKQISLTLLIKVKILKFGICDYKIGNLATLFKKIIKIY